MHCNYAVQRLHLSQPPKQHGTIWAVMSTAEWADCSWECRQNNNEYVVNIFHKMHWSMIIQMEVFWHWHKYKNQQFLGRNVLGECPFYNIYIGVWLSTCDKHLFFLLPSQYLGKKIPPLPVQNVSPTVYLRHNWQEGTEWDLKMGLSKNFGSLFWCLRMCQGVWAIYCHNWLITLLLCCYM